MTQLSTFLNPDGVTDNAPFMAALLADMAANPGETYTAKRGQVFRINGGGYTFHGNRLRLEGALFLMGVSVSPSTTFLTLGDDTDVDCIDIRTVSGVIFTRALSLMERVRADEVHVVSSNQQLGDNSSNVHGAVRILGSNCDVGFLHVENCDWGPFVWGAPTAHINRDTTIRRLKVESYRRGFGARNCKGLSVFDATIRRRSQNALPDPGYNGILLSGVEESRFIGGHIADSGEHGFRSGGFPDTVAGAGDFIPGGTRDLTVSDYTIKGAGQSGFKIWAGADGAHRDVYLNNIHVVDCGNDGDGLGFNDEGFMLQNVDGLTGSNLSATARDLPYCALDGFYLHALADAKLSGVRVQNAQRNGIRVSEFSDDTGLDPISTNGLDVPAPVINNSGSDAVFLNFPGTTGMIRDVMMSTVHVTVGMRGVATNAAISKFKQPCYFSVFARGLTGAAFALPTSGNVRAVSL